ncbi:hypothetical protein [Halobellus ruber]|uniref:Uncharacterized protein n=1 Tax=Halobellus ruber TaxID=2761102 RepID=A0A7J9SGE7_9EURY|nr:hypothetical protein [Halobellus ruber]MBB6645037.1 hypothetical protein [Halobellus ruber]
MSTESPSSTTDDTDLNRITYDHSALPRAANILGIDGAGAVHVHSPRQDRVWMLAVDTDAPVESEVTHEADLRGNSVHEWIAHVRGERGVWQDLRYDRGSWVAALGRHLAAATEAE